MSPIALLASFSVWPMSDRSRPRARTEVLTIDGPFATDMTAGLRTRFDALVRDGGGDVTLDLTASAFLDGSGIGAIGFLFKRLAVSGRRLVVVGASGQPRAMLAELGLAALLSPPVTAAAADTTSAGMDLRGTALSISCSS